MQQTTQQRLHKQPVMTAEDALEEAVEETKLESSLEIDELKRTLKFMVTLIEENLEKFPEVHQAEIRNELVQANSLMKPNPTT